MALKFYGGVRPQVLDGNFSAHDATATWDDAGAAQSIMDELIEDALAEIRGKWEQRIRAYGAEQVRDGVLDYLSNGYVDVAVHQGELIVAFDASNDQASLRAWVGLYDLLQSALKEARRSGDTVLEEAVETFAKRLPALTRAVESSVERRRSARVRVPRSLAEPPSVRP